ncbi:carboxypeptidase-like regulatory domain-containing protein [Spirosoma sp. KCTC 42546]|uniref:carboxypeptidase-like regulatory domain-containing protein n=1 Tax=Spirosoma sp. KCTC 42546 TaxID=2520506 RepID=UPI001159236C|nr:carboxypeptidase-like regulatory domain-containing protein [Spirosoma sp. KCTC 42546]QDK82302.1 carboxypeptidase-like regulatory domain-containing protein [Spirosoma sp. KCTC 42546]
MPYKRLFILCVASFLSWSGSAWAQGKYVIGTVIDQTTKGPVDKVLVVNQRTRQRARTNASGRFFLTIQPGDSLILTSQLYNRTGIRYDGSDNPTIVAHALPPMPYRVVDLAEVTVTGKRYEEVKREIQQLLDEPTASKKVTGEQAFDRLADGAGVTLLYEMFGKRPKSDRKAYYIMQQDRRHALALERFRLLVEQSTTLRADEVDRFFDFCDFDDDYLLKAEDYDLINTIQQLRNRFQNGINRRPSRIAPDPNQSTPKQP